MHGLDLAPRFVSSVHGRTGLNRETLYALVTRFLADMPWSRINEETGITEEHIATVYGMRWEAAITRIESLPDRVDRMDPPKRETLDPKVLSQVCELMRFHVSKADVARYLGISKSRFPRYWEAARTRMRELGVVVHGQALLLMVC